MQRYKFESNSQPSASTLLKQIRCLCQCKDTNLKAIHNRILHKVVVFNVVYANAKIQIWKQFTTTFGYTPRYAGCLCQCKDTNLKAIHNKLPLAFGEVLVVYANAKIQIWKQFTTNHRVTFTNLMLFMPMQRYKFESNSQPIWLLHILMLSCLCQCKDTNLKAIHNPPPWFPWPWSVVYANAKIQIWKQFTTWSEWKDWIATLFMPMQRYKFESNSQQKHKKKGPAKGCLCQCKDTNLKAIHNAAKWSTAADSVVYANAKIQIWKQFTTYEALMGMATALFMPMQRYKFESNSQQPARCARLAVGCLCQCKDTNLKAIHNSVAHGASATEVVYANAKIQIWKQFTTGDDL